MVFIIFDYFKIYTKFFKTFINVDHVVLLKGIASACCGIVINIHIFRACWARGCWSPRIPITFSYCVLTWIHKPDIPRERTWLIFYYLKVFAKFFKTFVNVNHVVLLTGSIVAIVGTIGVASCCACWRTTSTQVAYSYWSISNLIGISYCVLAIYKRS